MLGVAGSYVEGSSPRVRGAAAGHAGGPRLGGIIPARAGSRRQGLHVPRRGGIIPARAGSRPRTSTRPVSSGDHPRACGEQGLIGLLAVVPAGSSPRVRGAACSVRPRVGDCRIIPARAGSSL